jgi:hypothetical protein
VRVRDGGATRPSTWRGRRPGAMFPSAGSCCADRFEIAGNICFDAQLLGVRTMHRSFARLVRTSPAVAYVKLRANSGFLASPPTAQGRSETAGRRVNRVFVFSALTNVKPNPKSNMHAHRHAALWQACQRRTNGSRRVQRGAPAQLTETSGRACRTCFGESTLGQPTGPLDLLRLSRLAGSHACIGQ